MRFLIAFGGFVVTLLGQDLYRAGSVFGAFLLALLGALIVFFVGFTLGLDVPPPIDEPAEGQPPRSAS
jgi:hypothetical protein